MTMIKCKSHPLGSFDSYVIVESGHKNGEVNETEKLDLGMGGGTEVTLRKDD
jgi:hypothetical protein